ERIITSYPYVYADRLISDESLDSLIDYDEDSIPVLSEQTNELLGVITAQDLAEISFDELDEPEEMEEAKPVEKKDRSWMLILCGLAVLVIAALIGHGSLPDDKTRETVFILLLIAGAVMSGAGLYVSTSRKREQ
ncbi:MAG: hypothetical protein IKE12_08005, partial [Erysipelotrichaceae bacterium]|nr:hypothetical protein [Erysipelotrichaceae bacterium]